MNLPNKFLWLLCLIVLTAGFAVGNVSAQTKSSKQKQVKSSIKGNWGGKHIGLEITDSGATIEFDCARAVVEKPIIADQNGHFSIIAIYTQQSGGPVRQNSIDPSYRVKISGQILNKKMTLIIKRQSNNKSLGTFKLNYGAEPFLVRCL